MSINMYLHNIARKISVHKVFSGKATPLTLSTTWLQKAETGRICREGKLQLRRRDIRIFLFLHKTNNNIQQHSDLMLDENVNGGDIDPQMILGH